MTWHPGLFRSPLRYPGGKGKIANYVKLLFLENDMVGRDYIEPYAGGASVALTLLYEEYADNVHINDLNPGVYAFWHCALNATDELCDRIDRTPVTIEEWHRQRAVVREPESDLFDLGFATFYLNRTNRSGIISGGVIGGLNQHGPWKLDARYNKTDLLQRIKKVGRYRTRIFMSNLDANHFLEGWAAPGHPPAFLYMDPPYYLKGEGLYDNFYNALDHARVADTVSRLVHPWIVSYDAAPAIVDLYSRFEAIRYSLSYSAQTRGLGSEVMFFSNGLVRPDQSPSRVSSADVLASRTIAG